jgi:hypothetical protein
MLGGRSSTSLSLFKSSLLISPSIAASSIDDRRESEPVLLLQGGSANSRCCLFCCVDASCNQSLSLETMK